MVISVRAATTTTMTTLFVHIWNHQSELVFEGQSQLRWSVSSKYSYNLHAIYVRCHNIYTHRFDSYPRVRVIVYFILANKRNDCYVHGFNLVVGVTWWSSSNEDEGWDIKPVLQATNGRKGWDFYFQSKKGCISVLLKFMVLHHRRFSRVTWHQVRRMNGPVGV